MIKLTNDQLKDYYNADKNRIELNDDVEIDYIYTEHHVYCKGNLDCKGDLYCEGYLFCEGNLDCKGYLNCEGNLDCKGYLYCEGFLYCGGNLDCKGNLFCEGNLDCKGYLYCGGNLNCKGYLDCKGELKIKNELTKTYTRISGAYPYIIIITDNYIEIGCIRKTKDEWRKVTKKKAKNLDKDWEQFWSIKECLLNI